MKRIILYFAFSITSLIFFAGCGNQSAEHDHEHEETAASTDAVVSFKDVDTIVAGQLHQVVGHYMHLKDAMVASDGMGAKAAANGLLGAIDAVDVSKFTADQKKAYDIQIEKVRENALRMEESDDIEFQRGHLNALSESLSNLIRSFGSPSELYYDFCPMANDDKGGYWISESEEIKNPYFGDEMLGCGETKERLK